MNNACPGCGAVYNVTAKDVGRKLRCKKCSTPMVITEKGIESEDAFTQSPPAPAYHEESIEEEAPPSNRKKSRDRERVPQMSFQEASEKYSGLAATALYGFGAFLVIFHVFMPLVGEAKLRGRQAAVKEIAQTYNEQKEAYQNDKDLKDRDKKIEDLTKDYDKDTKRANNRVVYAELSNAQSAYFDRYLMMLGFLLVMVGSLMFMMPSQPLIKRIVGAVTITSQMVLVFFAFLGRSVVSG